MELNKEIPQHRFLISGLMVGMSIMAIAFWVKAKKDVSWQQKYQEDIQIVLAYVPDSSRDELIKKLKK